MEMEGANPNALKEEMGEQSFEKAKALIDQAKQMAEAKGVDFMALVHCCDGEPMEEMAEEPEDEDEMEGSSTEKEAKKTAIIIALKKKSDEANGY